MLLVILSAAWAISGSWSTGSLMVMVTWSLSSCNRTASWVISNRVRSGRHAGAPRVSRDRPAQDSVTQRGAQATGLQRLRHGDLAGREDQRHPVIVGGQHEDLPASAGDIPARRHTGTGLASRSPHDRFPLAAPTRAMWVGWWYRRSRARSGSGPAGARGLAIGDRQEGYRVPLTRQPC